MRNIQVKEILIVHLLYDTVLYFVTRSVTAFDKSCKPEMT